MADKKKKGASADDIIEALAQEMGVDEDEEATDEDGEETEEVEDADESEDDASAEDDDSAEDDEDEDEDEDEEPEPEPEPEPAPKKKTKKKSKAKAKPATKKAAADAGSVTSEREGPYVAPPMTNDQAISAVFSGTGEETRLGKMPELDDDLDGRPNRGFIWMIAALLIGGGAFAGVYFTLPEERKECLNFELTGRSCVEYYEHLEEQRREEERLQMLAEAPKYGTLTITTDPRGLRVIAEGHPTLIFPGSRRDMVVPSRSMISFQDIKVDEAFTFTLEGGGNFEDREITIPSYDDDDSPWVQNQFNGDYTADLVYTVCWPGSPDYGADHCLIPVEERARELEWRMNWEPPLDVAEDDESTQTRLFGEITVTSDPPGALVSYNGRLLVNMETGEPYVTPHTFSTYPPPPPEPPAEGEEPSEEEAEAPEPSEVYLSREGMPITVFIEGKLRTTDGVYMHHFICNPNEDAEMPPEPDPDDPDAEEPDFIEYCNYTYNIHLELRDPPADEGSGEGSGEEAGDDAEEGEEGEEEAE